MLSPYQNVCIVQPSKRDRVANAKKTIFNMPIANEVKQAAREQGDRRVVFLKKTSSR
jgi:hypothetical protein